MSLLCSILHSQFLKQGLTHCRVLGNIYWKNTFEIFIDFNIVKQGSVTLRVMKIYSIPTYNNRMRNFSVKLALKSHTQCLQYIKSPLSPQSEEDTLNYYLT